METFVSALGLAFVIEGVSYALFPDGVKRMMAFMLTLPAQQVRIAGLSFAIFGFLVIAVARG